MEQTRHSYRVSYGTPDEIHSENKMTKIQHWIEREKTLGVRNDPVDMHKYEERYPILWGFHQAAVLQILSYAARAASSSAVYIVDEHNRQPERRTNSKKDCYQQCLILNSWIKESVFKDFSSLSIEKFLFFSHPRFHFVQSIIS